MKANLILVLFLFAAATAVGCQDTDPAANQAPSAKLADDMSTRPASRRWFWWGGEADPAAPNANTPAAAPAGNTPAAAAK
jgi:hypothetical protein